MPQIFQDSLGEVLRCSGDIQPASMGCATANPVCGASCGTLGSTTCCTQCGGSGCHSCTNTGTAVSGNVGLVQFNNNGCLDGIPFSYYANGNLTLGPVANLKMLGGANTQILATDGTGNLYFTDSCCGELQPDMLFPVPVTGNNQTFTHPNIASFSNIANRGGGFANNYAEVFRNGVLVPSTDYTITGNVLTMNVPMFAGDTVIIAPTGANSAITDPAGINGELQFNNFGSFGNVPVAVYNGSVLTISNLSAGNTFINNLLDPVLPQDAATKAYVDSVATGLTVLSPVKAATTATLAGTYNNGSNGVGATLTLSSPLTTLDGVTLLTGDRVLLKDQAIASENGIYFIDALKTTLTRVADADQITELDKGTYVYVTSGNINGSASYVETANVSNIGNSAVLWNQFARAGQYTASNNVILVGSDFQLPVQANLTPGTYGNATLIPQITVNEFGVVSNIATVPVQLGNVANINLNGNSLTFLDGTGNWTTPNGLGTVTSVGTTTNGGNVPGLGFYLDGGNITSTGNVNLVTPTALQLANSMGLGNVAYANFTGNGSQVLYGNGVWANAGTGTVTRVGTIGSGLGFSLTGGNITSSGDVILTVPSAPALTSALGYGNIVYSNYNGNGNTVLTGSGVWAPISSVGGGNTVPGGSATQLQFNNYGTFGGVTATSYDGSKLTLGTNAQVKINGGTSGQLLTTDGLGNLSWVSVGISTGNIGGVNLDGNVSNVLRGDGTWGPTGAGGGGTVTRVYGQGSGLGFNLSGDVTSSGPLTLQIPTVPQLRTTLNIGTVANLNLNSSTTQFLRGDGQWVTPANAGVGTVTSVGTAGSGLGFSLTGGTITSAGTVQLNVPSGPGLVAAMGLGNIVYSNLTGNAGQVLRGDGTWGPATGGTGAPAGSNSQVQYNNNGAFGADPGMTFDPVTDKLSIGNAVSTGGLVDLRYGTETFAAIGTTSGTFNLDVLNNSTLYSTAPATGSVILNVRGNGTTPLANVLSPYQSIIVSYYMKTGLTAYSVTNLTIDGVNYPIKWPGGVIPSTTTNSTQNYVFQIVKLAAGYDVYGAMTGFI